MVKFNPILGGLLTAQFVALVLQTPSPRAISIKYQPILNVQTAFNLPQATF